MTVESCAREALGFGTGFVARRGLMLVALLFIGCGGVQSAPVTYESEEPFASEAAALLAESLRATREVADHPWRDLRARPTPELVRTLVETPKGATEIRRLDLTTGTLRVDRTVAPRIGPIPINRGFVPRSFAFDGDPLDALILGPPVSSGREVIGTVVGVLRIEHNGTLDPQLIVVPSRSSVRLSSADKRAVARWCEEYLGSEARVISWGDAEDANRILNRTLKFFAEGYGTFLDGRPPQMIAR